MKKTYYFMAGLPRSGSTLLKSILFQNPLLYTAPISPVMELMYINNLFFKTNEKYQVYPSPKSAYNLINNIPDNYYSNIERPIVIDHSRTWPSNIERIKTYITSEPKIICPMRNVLDVLTSYISMIHRNSDQVSFIDEEIAKKNMPINDDSRCDYLMSKDGNLRQALDSHKVAYLCDEQDYLLMVDYDDLVNDPEKEVRRIYNFLNIEYYDHNYYHIENKTKEDDSNWNLRDMHHVRDTFSKISKKPEEVLSEYVLNKYSKLEYWKDSNKRNY